MISSCACSISGLAFGEIELLALRLGEAVVFGVVVADEVVAVGGIGGDEQVVGQLVGVAALRPADHLPGGGVPALPLVPDDLVVLLAGQGAQGDVRPRCFQACATSSAALYSCGAAACGGVRMMIGRIASPGGLRRARPTAASRQATTNAAVSSEQTPKLIAAHIQPIRLGLAASPDW